MGTSGSDYQRTTAINHPKHQPFQTYRTRKNRMAIAQQHINALLFEGFNVWVDKNEPSLLHFDKLDKPTLQPQQWEAVVELNNDFPMLEKFMFEEVLSEVG